MPEVSDYLALVPDYNAAQPNFMATLQAVLTPFAALQSFFLSMPQAFDLDTAVGAQLDQIGLWIGVSRNIAVPITNVYFSWDIEGLGWEQGYWQGTYDPNTGIQQLDDNTYRQFLYAKASLNQWDGSPAGIVEAVGLLLQDEYIDNIQVQDNQDMTMQVVITGVINSAVILALINGNYLPLKPEGVSISYKIVAPPNLGAEPDPPGVGLALLADGTGLALRWDG